MDVAVWPIDDDDGAEAAVESLGTYQSSKLATKSRSVWLKDGGGPAQCAAMSWQTPLSLGYLLDPAARRSSAALRGGWRCGDGGATVAIGPPSTIFLQLGGILGEGRAPPHRAAAKRQVESLLPRGGG